MRRVLYWSSYGPNRTPPGTVGWREDGHAAPIASGVAAREDAISATSERARVARPGLGRPSASSRADATRIVCEGRGGYRRNAVAKRPVRVRSWVVRLGRLISIACVVWASSAPSTALADEKSDFEKARIAYVKKDYVEADARFRAMLDPKSGTLKTPALVDEAEFGWGAVKFVQGDKNAAHALWEKVIRDSMGQYQPDLLTYPTDVINDYLGERDRLKNALLQQQAQEAAQAAGQRRRDAEERARLLGRVKSLEKLASQETVVDRHSRLVALLPFGVGQFQNGKEGLGWFFLLTEGAALLTTAGFLVPYRYNIDQANAVWNDPTPVSLNYRTRLYNEYAAVAQNIRTADFITLGGLAALMIAGIVEAEVDYKPFFGHTRTRKLGGLWPSLSVLPGSGGFVGLGGTF